MIVSIYQIDFIDSDGATTRLLDHGDLIENFIDFSFNQAADEFAAILGQWGKAVPRGGARRPVEWARLLEHTSHIVAAAFCIRHPAEVPYMKTGTLRIEIDGGEVWDLQDAVLFSAATRLSREGDFSTLTNYKLTAGKTVPYSGLEHYLGQRMEWILDTHTELTTTHSLT